MLHVSCPPPIPTLRLAMINSFSFDIHAKYPDWAHQQELAAAAASVQNLTKDESDGITAEIWSDITAHDTWFAVFLAGELLSASVLFWPYISSLFGTRWLSRGTSVFESIFAWFVFIAFFVSVPASIALLVPF